MLLKRSSKTPLPKAPVQRARASPNGGQAAVHGNWPKQVIDELLWDAIFRRRFGAPKDFADLVLAICKNPMLNGEMNAIVRLRAR